MERQDLKALINALSTSNPATVSTLLTLLQSSSTSVGNAAGSSSVGATSSSPAPPVALELPSAPNASVAIAPPCPASPVATTAPVVTTPSKVDVVSQGPPNVSYAMCGRAWDVLMQQVRPVAVEVINVEMPSNLPDARKLEWLIETYCVFRDENGKARQVSVPPYDGHGTRMIVRDNTNQRRQVATTRKYGKGLISIGLVRSVRGQMFLFFERAQSRPRAGSRVRQFVGRFLHGGLGGADERELAAHPGEWLPGRMGP